MKSKLFVLLSLVLLIGCTNQNLKPITDAEKASIKLEIEKFLDILADDFNALNFDKTMSRSMSIDSSNIWFVTNKGEMLNYKEELEAIQSEYDFIKEFKDYNYVINEINVLSPEIAYATITYNVGLVFKDDAIESVQEQTVATSIYKKIDNQWMCIHWQETSSAPKEVISNN